MWLWPLCGSSLIAAWKKCLAKFAIYLHLKRTLSILVLLS